MAENQKDTIYIDIDDEITSIIDKVRSSKQRIVALVLPKRATMLQSSVNMKLLKKAADNAHKQAVLITTESGLLPLAGSVGLYVAKNLQSRPELPETAAVAAPVDELLSVDESEGGEEFDAGSAGEKPVGELAGLPPSDEAKDAKAKPELTPRPIPRAAAADEAIELDNGDEPADAAAKSKGKGAKSKNKKLKVPNFEKFRLRLILAVLLVVILIVGFILAGIILPHATIDVATNTSNANSNLTINLDPSATSLNIASLTVPAHLQQTQQTQNQTVNTTGQKNEGQTASGSVKMTAQVCSQGLITTPSSVPSGTGISANGLTFITQGSTSFGAHQSQNGCDVYYANSSTSIVAQNPGAQYNVNNAQFNVSYQDQNNSATTYSASGSASGGSDNIVQIVSQSDINNAEQKLTSQDTSSIKSALQQDLQQAGYYAIPATFMPGTPSTSTSTSVGAQASSVTVTQTTSYTMFGVYKDNLQTLITNDVNQQINTSKQSVLDTGVNSANFTVLSQSTSAAQLTMQATATVGPKLNLASLKAQVAGKKSGDAQSIINGNPGVTNVTVHLSPFWVGSVPKHTSKITIKLTKSNDQ